LIGGKVYVIVLVVILKDTSYQKEANFIGGMI